MPVKKSINRNTGVCRARAKANFIRSLCYRIPITNVHTIFPAAASCLSHTPAFAECWCGYYDSHKKTLTHTHTNKLLLPNRTEIMRPRIHLEILWCVLVFSVYSCCLPSGAPISVTTQFLVNRALNTFLPTVYSKLRKFVRSSKANGRQGGKRT